MEPAVQGYSSGRLTRSCRKGEHGAIAGIKALEFATQHGYGPPQQQVSVEHVRAVRYPVPSKDTAEWLERYGPMLHKGPGDQGE